MTDLKWLPVYGYEGIYEVSNIGKVRSLPRKVIVTNNNGTFNKSYPSKTLKSYITSRGYELVKLCKNGIVKSFSVHRLVAIAFISNPDNLPEINHLDGNKLNNVVSNLEWCSASDNQRHAFTTGLQVPNYGEKNGQSMLSEIEVLFIHHWKNKGHFAKELSEIFNLSKNHIQDILGFRRWTYLKGEIING